jgi:hypothetical protein
LLLCLNGCAPLEVLVFLLFLRLLATGNALVAYSALLDDFLGFTRVSWSVGDVFSEFFLRVCNSLSIIIDCLVVLKPVVDLGFSSGEGESLLKVAEFIDAGNVLEICINSNNFVVNFSTVNEVDNSNDLASNLTHWNLSL